MSRSPSPHYDRDSLYAPLRRADELPSHVKTDALEALAIKPRNCQGESCRQGRAPCTDRCGAEMAAPEADAAPSFWRSLVAFLMARRPY